MVENGRLAQQLQFILEVDKLKSVLRRSLIANGERLENSAEHSWHLALCALVLHEHANKPVNLARVLKMVLVHDIVEIDAGDTFLFDEVGNTSKAEREQEAANRIFGFLPDDQQVELHVLWEEFEARETADAKFAAALDRLMPALHNYHNQGFSWHEHNITSQQIMPKVAHMRDGSETLWQTVQGIVEDSIAQGFLTR